LVKCLACVWFDFWDEHSKFPSRIYHEIPAKGSDYFCEKESDFEDVHVGWFIKSRFHEKEKEKKTSEDSNAFVTDHIGTRE
jgi:hypothetical protein